MRGTATDYGRRRTGAAEGVVVAESEVLAAISLDFDDSPSAAEVERTATGLERRIKQAYPEIRRIFVEAQSREGRFQAGSGGLRRPGHSRGQRRLHARAP